MTNIREPVSILLPVKNGEQYLKRSIQNLINLTGSNDEVLVINDFSSDNTSNLLDKMQSKWANLRVINNYKPGLVNALNFGINEAKHNYIARADVDDCYESDRISKQMLAFKENTVAVFSDYRFRTTSGISLGTIPSPVFAEAVVASLIRSQRTAHPSVLFLKDAVIDAGGYKESDFPAEDLSLWLRLARLGDLTSVPEILLNYTLNPIGVTSSKRTAMLKKKRVLLDEIGLPKNSLISLENNAMELFLKYKEVKDRDDRQLLFITDLIEISRTYPDYLNLRKTGPLLLAEISKIGLFKSTIKFGFGKIARNILR